MTVIRLTSKRQATLPKELCEQMHLKPGDRILVDSRMLDGEKVWYLKTTTAKRAAWFGTLKKYGEGHSHDLDAIRKSIAKGRKNERA